MSARLRRLVVVLYGCRAGVIERGQGTLTFTYDEGYLAQGRATPLSLSMPLGRTPYPNRLVEAHLRGLLPDNADVRQRWARYFGLKDRDTFGLIAALGQDAPGGALYLPEDSWEQDLAATGRLEPVGEPEIAERLRRLRADAGDWLGDDEHWSLAGVQSKFTLRATDGGWAYPHGVEPSTHIVKPGISHIPGQALTEHVSQRALGTLGLIVAPTQYVEFEDQPAIVVTRFDRVVRDGTLLRVHQEDLCQAFGLDPARKYEADRGPGVARIADLLRTASGEDAVGGFARAVIANHLLGAPDAHAKNYSLLLAGPTTRLAPLYDVASGLLADREGALRYRKGAMSIGGERAFGQVHGRHWDAFAARCGLPPQQVRDWVRQTAATLPDALTDAIGSVPRTARHRQELSTVLVPRVVALGRIAVSALDEPEPLRRTGPDPAETIAAAALGAAGRPAQGQPGDNSTWG